MLLGLIAVLTVILLIMLGIAVFAGDPGEPTEPAGSTGAVPSETTGETQNSTEGTTQPPEEIGLTITSPETARLVSMEPAVWFEGTSDPREPLLVNGAAVTRNADGSFRVELALNTGENTFTFSHKGEELTYTVEHRYVVERFAPAGEEVYNSGATVHFEVSARAGSQVQVQFNGQTISLQESANQTGFGASEGFVIYTGSHTLTNTNTSDLNLGQITYTATCGGVTEVYTSGTVTCLKSSQVLGSDPSVTPSGGKYQDVGSGYIAEVINYSAETMYSWDNDGYSHPVNNYLPKGTLDYCSTEILTSNDGTNNYRQLRCGWRVFTTKNNPPAAKTKVIDCYIGTLPDHNEIGFVSMTDDGQYTVLTLDSMWKAPFRFELEAQDYYNPDGGSGRSYQVSSFTANYIDITFCYATVFTGDIKIPADNPVFLSAELTQNAADCTLRLYFKKAGGFYGWDAYYNEQDQLCFKFLNPAVVTAADNAYGADLTGVRIMLDVGHGGVDGGAVGYHNDTRYTEAERNMAIALALKEDLESMGATVILNRNDNATLTVDERILTLKGADVDLLVAIHHNSSTDSRYSGFESYYYSPISHNITHAVNDATKAAGIYGSARVGWHVYYMGRQTNCPVVLTENGYLSNSGDMANICNQEMVEKKADAIAQGVANYFLSLNGLAP